MMVSMKSLPSKLHLIAGGAGRNLAPYDGERWGVNATCIGVPVHVSFHLHDLEHPEWYRMTGTDKPAFFEPFLSYCKMLNHPAFSLREYPDFPSIKKFPYEELCDHYHTNFFSNSICYMLAYAAYLGYPEINMWGVNFALSKEYQDELPGVHYWLGRLEQMGYVAGENLRIFGYGSSMYHCLDGNSKKFRVSYSYGEPISYVPEDVLVNTKPYYGVAV